MAGCNVCHTPIENRLKLSKASPEDAVDATRFRSVVGSLRYLCNSRPDITHAVGMVSRFMEAPSTVHWAAVKQILRYAQWHHRVWVPLREGDDAGPCTDGVQR
jgi:hypothetical protein